MGDDRKTVRIIIEIPVVSKEDELEIRHAFALFFREIKNARVELVARDAVS